MAQSSQAYAEVSSRVSTGAATPVSPACLNMKYANEEPSEHHESEGKTHMSANGLNDRSISGHRRQNTSIRDVKSENQDWLAAQVARRSVQDVVDATGMTDKGVQNIRQRKAKISFDNLVELCRNDPGFAAAFAEHVGLILPGEAEFAGALTNAFNAFQRRQG